MNDWHIELKNIDKGRVCGKVIVAAPDLAKAKEEALRECRKYLHGKKNLYLEAKGGGTYLVVSDLGEVGEVKIRCLD